LYYSIYFSSTRNQEFKNGNQSSPKPLKMVSRYLFTHTKRFNSVCSINFLYCFNFHFLKIMGSKKESNLLQNHSKWSTDNSWHIIKVLKSRMFHNFFVLFHLHFISLKSSPWNEFPKRESNFSKTTQNVPKTLPDT
jgi:hypothetical protein